MTLIGLFDRLRHLVVGEPDDHGVYTMYCGKRFLRTGHKALPGTVFLTCPRCKR